MTVTYLDDLAEVIKGGLAVATVALCQLLYYSVHIAGGTGCRGCWSRVVLILETNQLGCQSCKS